MFEQISSDGRQRLARILPVLKRALQNRGKLSLRRLVESSWLSLNGPACVEASDLVDVRQFFALLEDLEMEGPLEILEERLGQLYAAPDPQAGPNLQLMTIHKAKGLEFDTVILPGLGRGVRSRDKALLRWLEHPDCGLLLSPIPPLVSEQVEPTYRAIGQILQEKDDFEALRLLYVAVTRAKSHLHLLGHVKINSGGELVPLSRSLLSVLWPACSEEFSQGAYAAEPDGSEAPSALTIKRLPLTWHPPALTERLVMNQDITRRASADGHYVDDAVRTRLTEEGRVVGILVHDWLERIACDGLNMWPPVALEGQLEGIKTQLSLQGIPLSRLDTCALIVLNCLLNTVGSPRGRWLLTSQQDAFCELALNGIIDGQLIRAIIDRTFLDKDSVRWIVDYKTSSPGERGDPDRFVLQELERYQGQLKIYQELVAQLYPEVQIRTALYFPFFDGWAELEL
jgi:hypothetical protein